MPKYRKKPVEIDAFKYDGDLQNSEGEYYVPVWAVEAFLDDVLFYGTEDPFKAPTELYVRTLEGPLHVSVGDYVIRGIHKELYPCKPDIFEKTYEYVGEEE